MTHTIREEIHQIVVNVLEKLRTDGALCLDNIGEFNLEIPDEGKFGDYSTNIAFSLAKEAHMSPLKIAGLIKDEIISQISDNKNKLLEKVEIAGKGFVNFYISEDYLHAQLILLCEQGDKYGKSNVGKAKKILLEFVSANPTGPLHIGHGRGAVIGDVLGTVFSCLGYSVEREYYLNDRGFQLDQLEQSLIIRRRELDGEEVSDEPAYKGHYVIDYARSIQKQGLQQHQYREYVVREILKDIKLDLKAFRVRFDNWFSETRLYKNNAVKKAIAKLEDRGYLERKDGALWFKSSCFGDQKDRVIIKKDKEMTYLASDIAYHENKFLRGFDTIINIWGADHHGYVDRVKGAVQALGYSPDKVHIILYQLVSLSRSGEAVSMSTRAGEFVSLREVMQEVGTDACRFFFLMRTPMSHLDFDLELAKKKSEENPLYYVQYAHARISSIFREAQKKASISNKPLNIKQLSGVLNEPEELLLLKKMLYYPELLKDIIRTYDPHWLTVYLVDLAKMFHQFYHKHRVINENSQITEARLYLIKGVQIILKNALTVLGISAPPSM